MGTSGITPQSTTSGPNVKPLAAQIGSAAAGTQYPQTFQQIAQALYLLQTNQDSLSKRITAAFTGSAGGGAPSGDSLTVTVDGVAAPGASETTPDFKGEHQSIRMWGAIGDALNFSDGAISATTNLFASASASFTVADFGKTIIIKGAGVAGAVLETQIVSIVTPNTVNVSVAAATSVTGAAFTYGTDNTTFIAMAVASGNSLFIPIGRYLTKAQINLKDLAGFSMYGLGAGSCLMPTSVLSNNYMDVSGSTNMEIRDFQIDGRWFPDLSLEIIYGDGTSGNSTYGPITVERMVFSNCAPLVCGIGANAPNTAQDITYESNIFLNCGYGSFGANVIDTGSSGTKLRFVINQNRFVFITQPSTAPGNGIFAGHGTNHDFSITSNIIDNSPSNGIIVYNRNFASEVTTLTNFMVSGNIIRNPAWNGISTIGGDEVSIVGNTVLNPGQSSGADPTKANGIFISTHHSGAGPTITGGQQLSIHSNNLIDNQSVSTMNNGILESDESPATEYTTGEIGINNIAGQTGAPVVVEIGLRQIGIVGDVKSAKYLTATNSLFNQLMTNSAVSAAGFLVGIGMNIYYDLITGDFITGADGVSNGAGAILTSYGPGDILFFTVPGPGGTPQTISAATFLALERMRLNHLGHLLIGSSTDSGTGEVLQVTGNTKITGTISASNLFANPMTTLGDLIYEDATPAPTRLPGNATTTLKVLTQTGAAGPVSAAPVWVDPNTFTPPASQQSVANPWFGTPTTSRAIAGVYQNLTGFPLFVTVSVSVTTPSPAQLVSDPSATPTTVLAEIQGVSGSTLVFSITAVILPGNYYAVSAGSLVKWCESLVRF